MSQFGIGKQTVRNLPAGSHAIAAGQVGVHDPEIVDADMGEIVDSPQLRRRPKLRALWSGAVG